MATQQTTFNTEQGNTTQQSTGRPVIRSTEGVISSGHYLTSMAGTKMLLSGGNAFDALVAAGFAAAVVEPIASYSLAAEGVFMLHDAKTGDVLSLSGQGTAPGQATASFYKEQGLDRIATGPGHDQSHLSFTLPGVVHAFISLAERYGHQDHRRTPGPGHQVCGGRHPQLRVHAESPRLSRHRPAVRPLRPRRLGRVLQQPTTAGSRLAAGAARHRQHPARDAAGLRQRPSPVQGGGISEGEGCLLPGPDSPAHRRLRRQRRRHLEHGRSGRLPLPVRHSCIDHIQRL